MIFFLIFILVLMWMVQHHHVVFSILIIMSHQHHHIINNNMVRQIQQVKQQQQLVIVECIDANHFCTNVTATMIFHQNVFRAIRPSDLNCKQLVRIYSIDKERKKEKKKRKSIAFFSSAPSFLFSLFSFFSFRDRSFVFFSLVANCTPGSGGARVYMSDSLSATHSEPNICRVIDE